MDTIIDGDAIANATRNKYRDRNGDPIIYSYADLIRDFKRLFHPDVFRDTDPDLADALPRPD